MVPENLFREAKSLFRSQ